MVELSLPSSISMNNVRVKWTLQDGTQLNDDEMNDSYKSYYTVCSNSGTFPVACIYQHNQHFVIETLIVSQMYH